MPFRGAQLFCVALPKNMFMKRPEQKLMNFLKDHGITIGVAESMTCGMVAAKLGSVSGTSEAFTGSIVCYDEKVKTGLLRIPVSLIKKHTAESSQVTDTLAKKLANLLRTQVSVAITGLAAPGASESKQKPVGTVF